MPRLEKTACAGGPASLGMNMEGVRVLFWERAASVWANPSAVRAGWRDNLVVEADGKSGIALFFF